MLIHIWIRQASWCQSDMNEERLKWRKLIKHFCFVNWNEFIGLETYPRCVQWRGQVTESVLDLVQLLLPRFFLKHLDKSKTKTRGNDRRYGYRNKTTKLHKTYINNKKKYGYNRW